MADRITWLQDFDLITTVSKHKAADKAARDVFDALGELEKCGLLVQKFGCPKTQRQAIFLLNTFPDVELIRVVVRLDLKRVFVSYVGNRQLNRKWPSGWGWEEDFRKDLGIPPKMGHDIVNWCAEGDGNNTKKLIRWLIDKTKSKSVQ